ncbi:UDP-N-acetylmuramoyl-tripeptide--D-alanyl-D-alanine ligase [Patescibacteria group bacterium]
MDSIAKKIVTSILRFEADLVLKQKKPFIIGITGSVGKTSAKEAIFSILSQHFRVTKSPKSYNSEFGVPLTLLGLESAWTHPIGWMFNLLKGAWRVISCASYADIFVLEMGVDRPGDLEKLLSFINPSIALVTAIGEVPVHVEFFSGPEEVAREKSKLVKKLKSDDYAVLNFDDEIVREMKNHTKAQVLTYGLGEGADVCASNCKILSSKTKLGDIPRGFSFKLEYDGNTVPVRINGAFGKQHIYAALAAAAVGIAKGLNIIEISEALTAYESPPGRLKLIPGIKETRIIDDTYNASPLAMHAALDVVKELDAKRKICVLGDMMEIGKFTIQAHQIAGKRARIVSDIIFTVGPRAKFIAEEAIEEGMTEHNVSSFNNSEEAGRKLQEILEPGDLVLIKGSQAMRMEKIVEEIMLEPTKAPDLLVRQEPHWKEKSLSPQNEMARRLLSLVFVITGLTLIFFWKIIGAFLIFLGIYTLFTTRKKK